ncbi:MAG: PDZ domain-containing protein [Deltaproteobacteria bacterium]|nr:PDZ domain-containing protein [Deltaproteobacteria bacterium]
MWPKGPGRATRLSCSLPATGSCEQALSPKSSSQGWLGVSIQDLTPELADYYGVKAKKGALVGEVFEGNPADESGIKAKDVIIAVPYLIL